MTNKFLVMLLLAVAAAPALALKPLPAGYDTPAKIEKGFQALLKDEPARKRYCRMNAIDPEAMAAYKAGDSKKVAALNQEQKKLRDSLPMEQGYVGISMKNAMNSSFFQTPEAVAMNKAVTAVIDSCRAGKP